MSKLLQVTKPSPSLSPSPSPRPSPKCPDKRSSYVHMYVHMSNFHLLDLILFPSLANLTSGARVYEGNLEA